ncbi:hypothetical protein Nekkels1_45 [Cellulophaga phage Nekkels_1]|uniref:Uncharacterized protein n=1 Tax=Cellulophaga phage Nekkels_1 TaxID=2745692 RepID=A0A8E4XXU6_9CAUD|nr:hypothetical protein M1M31_gp45 [Cellulophaga phage Nekkels_1]QQO97047.1 hypothetical protein Nekkels1_45 [Cellulophaga phage Nekkels_1]QQO97140.1 hypothetical protein Nekkels2_45 [Cellulophaga phage Nekkels_2]
MAIETKNFVFGSDFLLKSESDFKAHMKKTHGVGARQAKEIYKEIHGDNSTSEPKLVENSEPSVLDIDTTKSN